MRFLIFLIVAIFLFQVSCATNRAETEESYSSSEIAHLFETQIQKQFQDESSDDLYINFLGSFESGLIQSILFEAIDDSIANTIFGLNDFDDLWVKKSFSFDDIVTEEIIIGNNTDREKPENPEQYGVNFEGEFFNRLNQSDDEVLIKILNEGEQIINNLNPAIIAGAILSSYENEEIELSSSMKDFIAAHLYGTTILQMHDYVMEYAE